MLRFHLRLWHRRGLNHRIQMDASFRRIVEGQVSGGFHWSGRGNRVSVFSAKDQRCINLGVSLAGLRLRQGGRFRAIRQPGRG